MKRLLITIASLYSLMAIAVFGNAVVHFEKRGNAAYAECERTATPTENPFCEFKKSSGIDAAFAAAFWPFYVSYRLAQISQEPI